jgi:ElaB/YqjD/DUF883 family membrane-anchored ribosome-binding protein
MTGAKTGATETGVPSETASSQDLERSDLAGQTSGSRSGSSATGTATALAQEYGQKISEAANTAKDYVSDKVSVVGDKIKDLQNKDLNEIANQAKDFARQNPGQAILISAAAGLVLGLILRGNRR